MLILAQAAATPLPANHPGPWSPAEIWIVLLVPLIMVVFLGFVFVRSRRK